MLNITHEFWLSYPLNGRGESVSGLLKGDDLKAKLSVTSWKSGWKGRETDAPVDESVCKWI